MVAVPFRRIGHHDGIDAQEGLLPFQTDQVFVPEGDVVVLPVFFGNFVKELAVFRFRCRSLYNQMDGHMEAGLYKSVEKKPRFFSFRN